MRAQTRHGAGGVLFSIDAGGAEIGFCVGAPDRSRANLENASSARFFRLPPSAIPYRRGLRSQVKAVPVIRAQTRRNKVCATRGESGKMSLSAARLKPLSSMRTTYPGSPA